MRMINKRKLLLVTVLVLLINILSTSLVTYAKSEAITITLKDAVEMARENNSSTKYAQLNRDRISNSIGDLMVSLSHSIYIVESAIELENTRLSIVQQLEGDTLSTEERANLQEQLAVIEMQLYSQQGVGASSNQLLDGLEQARISQQLMIDNEEIEKYRFDFSIESQYINLLILDRNIVKLDINLNLTGRALEIERLKNDLGMTNVSNLNSAFLRFNQLKTQLSILKSQQQIVHNNFKNFLGIPKGTDLFLLPIEFTGVKFIKYENGLINALNGLTIQSSEREVRRRKDHLSNVVDRYPLGSNRGQNPQLELKEAEYKLEDLKSNIEVNFRAIYNDLIQKEQELKLAEQTLKTYEKAYELEELKYTLGLVSKLEFENRKAEFELKEIELNNSKDEYSKSLKTYEYTQKGIILGR